MLKKIIVSIVLVGIFALGGINFSFIGLGINTVHACLIGPNGDCVPVPVGRAGRHTENNTRTSFWSEHNTRQHRPDALINNTVIRSANWGNPGIRHWTDVQIHAANATLRDGWMIR